MDSEFVATPLTRGGFSRPFKFELGVSIRSISPILWDRSVIAQQFMSLEERKEMSEAPFWLAIDEPEKMLSPELGDRYTPIKRALSSLQIIHPVGAKNAHLGFRQVPGGLEPVHSCHPQKLKPTLFSKFLRLDQAMFEKAFNQIHYGVIRAERERIVRLQNPIVLLELGMQADHPYISTLLWTMGLDMLLMAGRPTPFCSRIKNFLGSSTPVFPAMFTWRPTPSCPSITVSDVVKDLYALRSEIAHGHKIPPSFGTEFDLTGSEGETIVASLQYSQILSEAALFLLTSCLYKVFTMNMVDEVKSDSHWRKRLESK